MNTNSLQEVIEELRKGRIVVVSDDPERENEADLICAGQFASPDNLNFMATFGKGLVCMPVSEEIALRLKLGQMVENNSDNHSTAFTQSIDYKTTKTGISAFERSETALAAADENSMAEDFRRPGHLFPLLARNGGVLERAGHTEATVDLMRAAGLRECGLCCEIMGDDGRMLSGEAVAGFCEEHQLKRTTIAEIAAFRKRHERLVEAVSVAELPTSWSDFKVWAFREKISGAEHLAIVKGNVAEESPVLCRVHSECLTGEVLGSLRCDCGPQLRMAMERINQEGTGVIVYLRQEGRGIGLHNKLRAYQLQDQGLDTVDANLALGFPADSRDYSAAASILKCLGVSSVRLMTNNTDKIRQLTDCGITVSSREPIEVRGNGHDEGYLMTKYVRMGHLLHPDIIMNN